MEEIYSENKFKQQFLMYDFDNVLVEQDNKLVNSNELYIRFKTEYITETTNNFEKLQVLLKRFNELSQNYSVVNNKYNYTYRDTGEYNTLKYNIKILIENQKRLYDNFLNYIQFLLSADVKSKKR